MDMPLTGGFRADGEAPDLREYERRGGYEALRAVRRSMTPGEVTAEVIASALRGRGGAGFPTGKKWTFVPKDAPHPRYVIANADEMEPGTFKDRALLERDPHLLVEGLLLCAWAVQAEVAWIFLRAEYTLAERRVRRAVAEAAGELGGVAVHVHTSAGRYMCGEETGLLNALEGRRATPRHKPPYPQVSGLFGKPTIVQNVETLCCLPGILKNGAAWFRGLARTADGGTKLFGASGKVRRPGLWELPMGTTVREVLEEHAGGMKGALALRGLLPGGASTAFLGPEHLDVPLDFASVEAAGSRLGTGTMIVLDSETCPVGMVANLEAFFARESCGWCTPCREGLPWVARTLATIERGEGRTADLGLLERHARWLGPGLTFCALAPGAADPLQSALARFREDFERHVREARCPWL